MPDWSLSLSQAAPAWTVFDANHYSKSDTKALLAARNGNEAALADYHDRGAGLGYPPNPFFDPAFYIAANADIAGLIGTDAFPTAFDHYRIAGWPDRDPHWLFSTRLYGKYPDLTPEIFTEFGGPYGHYLRFGAAEGRIGHDLFDPACYRRQLPSEEAAANPFGHFLARYGQAVAAQELEPNGSDFFDPQWYLSTHADAARAVAEGRAKGALHHYLTAAGAETLDPLCDFSEEHYLGANPDVALKIAEREFRNGYAHFLRHGARELRSPCGHIDLRWYAEQPAVAADLAAGRFSGAYAHALRKGIALGLPLQPPPPADFTLNEAESRTAFVARARHALPGYGRHKLNFGHAGEPEVSVIVVLRNHCALTLQALASLRHTVTARIQLVLVDNGSMDPTTSIGEWVLGATIIRLDENIGFLRACNMALPHTTAPAVLYLNNDVILHANAVQIGRDRLAADATLGAVGGKIVRTHGLLQEAGCLLWRDGSAEGWMRDAPPDAPEANYVREVDFCSGAFLLVRGDLLRRLGGFDEAFAPAYYEETDLCLRIKAAGFRVLYDPAISLTHLEFGSSRSLRAATALMRANRALLQRKHAPALRDRLDDRSRKADAAARASRGRRVLFIEDTIPLARFGSGYGRAADVIHAMARAGWQVSVFPMHAVQAPLQQLTAALPETVEPLWNRDRSSLKAFLDARRGYYDIIWISRAHNFRQFREATEHSFAGQESAAIVLDSEAVFSLRDQSLAVLEGRPFDLQSAIAHEFDEAWMCDHVVAVNAAEADTIRSQKLSSVGIVGFRQELRPGANSLAARRGLLHLGAMTGLSTPNVDGLRWYLEAVQPALQALVGPEAALLTVAGHLDHGIDLGWLRMHAAVRFVGTVSDPASLYDAARVFLAPTRFGAGMPTKVLDAASHGLPVAGTSLLARQLGWTDGVEMQSAPATDPAGLAARIARLLTDDTLWQQIREAAMEAVHRNCSPSRFDEDLVTAMATARRTPPGRVSISSAAADLMTACLPIHLGCPRSDCYSTGNGAPAAGRARHRSIRQRTEN